MSGSFAGIVEDVKQLSVDEKVELRDLIDGYLIEERRDAIYAAGEESRRRLASGELTFSADIDDLMRSLGD